MTKPMMSPVLIRWAKRAGYSFRPQNETPGGVFWTDPGGEIQFFVRTNEHDWWTLHSSERLSGNERFEIATYSLGGIEKYLLSVFGSDIRLKNGLPRLKTARRQDEAAAGFLVGNADLDGIRRLYEGTSAVAVAQGGTGASVLAEMSYLLAASVNEIVMSYEQTDGRPLFRA